MAAKQPSASNSSANMFNHTAILTRRPDESRRFYRELGLTEIAELAFDTLTVWLMGNPRSSESHLTHREGLLEIVYPHTGGETELKQKGKKAEVPGLVKLCFTVPKLEDTLKSLASEGEEIIKSPSADGARDLFAARLGISYSEELSDNKALWDMINGIALVLDPDGYLIELVQQVS